MENKNKILWVMLRFQVHSGCWSNSVLAVAGLRSCFLAGCRVGLVFVTSRPNSSSCFPRGSWSNGRLSLSHAFSLFQSLFCSYGYTGPTYLIQSSSVTQSHPTLWDPMDYSPPGSSVHGVLQARILECVAIPFSRGSSWPKDRTWVSCIAGRFFTVSITKEANLS